MKPLGVLVDEGKGVIRTGPFGSQLHQADYSDDVNDTPVVMPRDMSDGRVDVQDIARVRPDKVEELSHHQLVQGDIVLARRGDIGRCAWIGEREAGFLCGTGSMRISTGSGALDSKFLFYALLSDGCRSWLQGQAVGATMPNINADIVRQLPVPCPPMATQRRIADVLTAFDELIKNNRWRIEILEETARSLYREWFVRYRFPGHESVEFVDSPIGKVPTGWKVEPVGDVIQVIGGGTPSRAEEAFWLDALIPWYTPTDLTRRTALTAAPPRERISQLGLQKSSARLFPAGTVMLTSRATIGVSAIAPTEACTNQGFINCVTNDRFDQFQVLFWMRENVNTFISHASGATFKELSKSTFKKLLVLVPGEAEVVAFRAKVEPIVESTAQLEAQARVLEETRDLLLPKLVIGKIEVKSLGVDDVFGWGELASELAAGASR